jgi:menaquinone-dependent protoporphyrinogen oxidase
MIQIRVLVAYATKHGSTREVAEAVARTLRARHLAVDVLPADTVPHLRQYHAVVLGGALYTGRLHKDARRFLARHRDALAGRTLAVFAMGPRTLEPADVAASRKQLDRALTGVAPASVAIFGGVIEPQALRFPFNRMPAVDARDWDAIERWANTVADAILASRRAPIHVVPDARGSWQVRRHGDDAALSVHGSETDAERAAATAGVAEIVVHDRYGRVHDIKR